MASGAPGDPTRASRPRRPTPLSPLALCLRVLSGLVAAAGVALVVLALPALAWNVAFLGLGTILLGLAPGLLSLGRRRRGSLRGGLLAAAVGLGVVLPYVVPSFGYWLRDHAPMSSLSLEGGRAHGPWFPRLPERELAGIATAWWLTPRERRTLERAGGVRALYEACDRVQHFDRPVSWILDSWLFDRGHLWLMVPNGDGPFPLLVLLHGQGGNLQLYPHLLGQPAWHAGVALAFPTWGGGAWSEPAAQARVADVVTEVTRVFAVDAARVVVAGVGPGGAGVVRLLESAPAGRYAAGVAISGVPEGPVDAAAVARTPLLVFHGADDERSDVARARALVQAVRAAGGRAGYVEFDADALLFLSASADVVPRILEWTVTPPRAGGGGGSPSPGN